jgi:hypothetical protein
MDPYPLDAVLAEKASADTLWAPRSSLIRFKGVSKYLIAHICGPRLDDLEIIILDETRFDPAHIAQFISRTVPQQR